jgi:nucleoside-diphosphate-sugar epimerase
VAYPGTVITEKVVLPGGAGLVGQNLIARLVQRGYTNLVAIDKHTANIKVLRELFPQVTVIEADLAQPGTWQRSFADASAVVMLQAQIGGNEREPFSANNITSSRHVLAAMKEHKVPYLVHISSSVVESVAVDHYSTSKREQEELVLAAGVPCIVLRPTLMFGWFDRKHLGWLSRFMRKVPLFPIPGDGKYLRQPLYVGDFCNVILRCLESKRTGEVLNISGVERIDYVDMIRIIRDAIQARTAIVHIPYGLFKVLLDIWAKFDEDPPFTSTQLAALTAGDQFEVIDWPSMFDLRPTPFAEAVRESYCDPHYSKIALEF